MKRSTLLAVALVSSSALSGSQALAAGLGGGQIVISADRLFGLSFASQTTEDGATGGKNTDSRTSLSLLWPPLSALSYSPYQIPHLSLDYILPMGLSVGGSLAIITGSGTSKTEAANGGASVERDAPSITIMELAPSISFWPRAGFTLYSIKSSSTSTTAMPITSKTTYSGLGIDLEAMFVLSLADHFGIVAGPVLDLPLSGTRSSEQSPQVGPAPVDDKVKFTNYGLAVGVLGNF
jgi:hypothetical protein